MSTEQERKEAAEKFFRNQLTIKELEAENAELKEFWRNEPLVSEDSENYQEFDGRFYIKRTPNKRIDDGFARKALSKKRYELVAKQTIDTAKARALLTDKELESVTKVFDDKVEVGIL